MPTILRASVIFSAAGLVALLFGLKQIGNVSFELGRLLFFDCLALAILTFLISLASRPRPLS